jgi:CheY-like chemotaxis protein
MSEETILRIFDPFFTTKLTGRGMGLAAVLAIVKGHRGTIKVTSTPGQGTLMQVLFPCTREARVPAAEIARQSQTWKGEGTILVVDEDEAIRTFTRRILTRAGFQVLEAGDGREGSAAFRQHRDELAAVALDLTTPFLDGVESLHELLRTHASIPVLLLSSHEEPPHLPGAVGFLAKPFAPSDLLKLLRTALPQ